MRVRRVASGDDLEGSLAANEPDVLPLWFCDAERDWIARAIHPDLAQLAPGDERAFAGARIGCGADDWVLASAPVLPLARRYAALTDRPLVVDPTARGAWPERAPRTITW